MSFWHRRRKDADLAAELQAHLEHETAERMAAGLSRADAEAAARRRLGNLTRVREEVYTMNTLPVFENIARDVRYGLRSLAASPGFTAVAVLSLALGIGANTAMFQLFDAIRLRTLPVAHPEELVDIAVDAPDGRSGSFTGRRPVLTAAIWEQLRERQQAFSGIFAFSSNRFNVAPAGEIRRIEGLYASGTMFETLGVQAHLGRVLTPADDTPACASPAAVLGYAFWQREFAGNPDVLGRRISLERASFPIVGVAPAEFSGPENGRQFDVVVPLCAETPMVVEGSALKARDHWWLSAFGRRKEGWSPAQVTAHLRALSPAITQATLPPGYSAEDTAAFLKIRLEGRDAGRGVGGLRDEYGDALTYLMAIAGMLLLIACANIANLLLARGSARQREFAVRLALGASRGRLVAQLLTETALLAAAGAAAGVLLAGWLSRFLVQSLSSGRARWVLALDLDWRVLGFTALLATLSAAAFGLAPALRFSRTGVGDGLRGKGRSSGPREGFALRRGLVAIQVALALVLLSGSLLLLRTLRNLMTAETGFRTSGLLVVNLEFPSGPIPLARRVAAYRELLERLRAAPGVESAVQVSVVPGMGWGENGNFAAGGSGQTPQQSGDRLSNINFASDGYFTALATPLEAGRDFQAGDTPAARRVAIVNRAFANKFFPGQNPLGQTIRWERRGGWTAPIEVVGIAADSAYESVRAGFKPIVYFPQAQDPEPGDSPHYVLYSRLPFRDLTAAARQAVTEFDPRALVDFMPHQGRLRERMLQERLLATLTSFFGGVAVLLAVVGLYGVISFRVARRKTEIGIRLALGATRAQVLALVARETAGLTAAGLLGGVVLTLGAARAARSLLYGVGPHDPVTLAAAVLLLGLAAGVAGYLPARRAAAVDPATALRQD